MFNQLYYDQFSKDHASQIALANNHLDGIKYIYSCQKSYLRLYDQYNTTQALKVAEQLKDVKGIAYIYKKNNKNYLKHLYDDIPQQNIKKAQVLNDLKGFKYICKSLGISHYDLLYKIDSASKNIENDITNKLYYAAIVLEDFAGVEYILNNSKALYNDHLAKVLKNHTNIILESYHKNNLAMAYELLKAGAKFEMRYIIKPANNLKLNTSEYANHLNNIHHNGYITDEEYKQTKALLNTLFTKPIKIIEGYDLGYSLYELLVSSTYTENDSLPKIQTIYDKYISSKYQAVRDVIKFVALKNLGKKPINILLPPNGQNSDPHYSGNIISDPYKDYYIYTPVNLNETTSALLHEMGHFLFDAMFNNSAKVYTGLDYKNNSTQYLGFRSAAKNTLVNILGLLQDGNETITNKEAPEIAKYLRSSAAMLLNHYISDAQQGVINVVLETSLLKAYVADKVSLQKLLNSTQDKRTKILENTYNKYHWSKDDSYLLERVNDYVGRDEKQYDIELVNRLPELQIKGLNKKTIKQLEPILKWWKSFITPVVERLVNEHIDQCKTWIKSGSIQNNNKEYCILDIYDQNSTKNLLFNSQTKCDLIEAKINSFAYVDGKKSDMLIQSNAGKELLYSVQNIEQSKCIKSIISKFNLSQTLIEQSFVKAAEKGYYIYADIILKNVNITLDTKIESLKKSINQMNQCILAKSFNEYCHIVFDNDFLNLSSKTEQSYAHTSCVLYNNIAHSYDGNNLEMMIMEFSGEANSLLMYQRDRLISKTIVFVDFQISKSNTSPIQ